MGAEHAARDYQGSSRGDVRCRHRGPFISRGDAEAAWRSGEGNLEDVPSRRLFGMTVGIAGKVCVRSASSGYQRQTRAVIGVVRQATVLRSRAHGDDVRCAGGIGDRGVRLVASGSIDEHAAPHDIDVACLEGSGYASIDGEEWPLRAGETLRWPRERRHRLWTDGNTMTTLMLERLGRSRG